MHVQSRIHRTVGNWWCSPPLSGIIQKDGGHGEIGMTGLVRWLDHHLGHPCCSLLCLYFCVYHFLIFLVGFWSPGSLFLLCVDTRSCHGNDKRCGWWVADQTVWLKTIGCGSKPCTTRVTSLFPIIPYYWWLIAWPTAYWLQQNCFLSKGLINQSLGPYLGPDGFVNKCAPKKVAYSWLTNTK